MVKEPNSKYEIVALFRGKNISKKVAMSEIYECTFCGRLLDESEFDRNEGLDRKRPVYSHCKQCRKRKYQRARYQEPCIQCYQYTKVASNRLCSKCNEEKGLKECRKCGELLPIPLSFYKTRATCKTCLKTSSSSATENEVQESETSSTQHRSIAEKTSQAAELVEVVE